MREAMVALGATLVLAGCGESVGIDSPDWAAAASPCESPALPTVEVYRTSDQALTHGTPGFLRQLVFWDGERGDSQNIHDPAANPQRLTIPSGTRQAAYRIEVQLPYRGWTITAVPVHYPHAQVTLNQITVIAHRQFTTTDSAAGTVSLTVDGYTLMGGDFLDIGFVDALDAGESWSLALLGGSAGMSWRLLPASRPPRSKNPAAGSSGGSSVGDAGCRDSIP